MRPRWYNRFISSCYVDLETGCWIWTGSFQGRGYGRFIIKKQQYRAHRISYELFKGPISDELHIDHICCNPSCVNPEHLDAVTHQENLRRAALRRTVCKRGLHELTPDNILYINNRPTCYKCWKNSQDQWKAKNKKRQQKLDMYRNFFQKAARDYGLIGVLIVEEMMYDDPEIGDQLVRRYAEPSRWLP